MNKSGINGILAVMSVLVLLIPIGVSGYVQEKTVSNIIEIQGEYSDGYNAGIYDGSLNMSEIFEPTQPAYAVDNILGYDSNNDTIFHGYKTTGVYTERDGTYYGDYNTYIGSGQYQTVVDWGDVPYAEYNSVRYLYIPLNMSNENATAFDFMRINTDLDLGTNDVIVRLWIHAGTQMVELSQFIIDNDTTMFIFDYDTKQILNANPDGMIIIGFSAVGDGFNESQTSFTWETEFFTMESSDYVFGSEFTDFTVWIIMVLGMDAFYLFVVVFANPVIDIKIDNSGKKGKWRR